MSRSPLPLIARPAVIYARISRDAEIDENGRKTELGVTRQLEDCRALAQKLGFEVAEEYVDNDIGASTKSRKLRPAYSAMIEAARAGRIGAIIAYSNSRLTRRVREYLDLIDLVNRHDVAIRTVVSGDHNLATADGRGTALTLAVWDQAEAERTGERVRRAKEQAATEGRWRGGPRPFGFEKDGVTIHEPEAKMIREATRSLLAGRSLAALAREWNELGSTGTLGKRWTYSNLRDMLLRPRNAGLIARGLPGRKGRGQGEPDWSYETDVLGEASWPAIVDVDEWRALVAMLANPNRRMNASSATRWLGSGIYRCGRDSCGSPLRPAPHGGTRGRAGERSYLYRCTASAHLTVSADKTDEFVRSVVAEMVRDPRVARAMLPDDTRLDADRDRRAALAARLSGFEDDYAAGRITGVQLQRATSSVTAELAAVDDRLAVGLRQSTSTTVLDAVDPGAAFLAAPVDVQRAVLASVLRVEIGPVPYRGAAWTPERVNLTPAVAIEEVRKPEPAIG